MCTASRNIDSALLLFVAISPVPHPTRVAVLCSATLVFGADHHNLDADRPPHISVYIATYK